MRNFFRRYFRRDQVPGWLAVGWTVVEKAGDIDFLVSLYSRIPGSIMRFLSEWYWIGLLLFGFVWLWWVGRDVSQEEVEDGSRFFVKWDEDNWWKREDLTSVARAVGNWLETVQGLNFGFDAYGERWCLLGGGPEPIGKKVVFGKESAEGVSRNLRIVLIPGRDEDPTEKANKLPISIKFWRERLEDGSWEMYFDVRNRLAPDATFRFTVLNIRDGTGNNPFPWVLQWHNWSEEERIIPHNQKATICLGRFLTVEKDGDTYGAVDFHTARLSDQRVNFDQPFAERKQRKITVSLKVESIDTDSVMVLEFDLTPQKNHRGYNPGKPSWKQDLWELLAMQ